MLPWLLSAQVVKKWHPLPLLLTSAFIKTTTLKANNGACVLGFLLDDWVRLVSSVLDLDGVDRGERVQVTSGVGGRFSGSSHLLVSMVKTVSVNSTFLEGIFVRRGAKAVIVLIGSQQEGGRMGLRKCCKDLPGKAQAGQQCLCAEHGPSATWSSGIERTSLAAQEAPFCLVLKKRGF